MVSKNATQSDIQHLGDQLYIYYTLRVVKTWEISYWNLFGRPHCIHHVKGALSKDNRTKTTPELLIPKIFNLNLFVCLSNIIK